MECPPLPLQSCDSWMFVKQNPDRKKKLSKIELLARVNRWEALSIFAKKLHLGYFIGLWMPLCILTVYLMVKKKDILRLDKWIGEGDK